MDFQKELDALYQKAFELKTQGQQADADVIERKAAEILQGLKNQVEQNPDDPATAAMLLYLAEREWAILGDHQQVQSRIERALALAEKRAGGNHVLTAQALAKLAEFHFLAGRFGQAEPLYRKALAIEAAQKTVEGIAHTLAALGRAGEADPYFARAIDQAGTDDQGKRSLYFLLMTRAEGLEKLNRAAEAEAHRQKAAALLPRNNPGESGFQA